jgi:multicomponent Na+:H+ antiporter subunit D
LIPIASLAILTCVIGFFPEPFVQFAERSAAQLLDPTDYITAVLGNADGGEGTAALALLEDAQ